MIKLRDYQENVVRRLAANVTSGSQFQLASLPSGSGSTTIQVYLASVDVARRVLIVTTGNAAADHTSAMLTEYGVPHTRFHDDHPYDPEARVCVGSLPTMANRNMYPDADVVLVDNAHARLDQIRAMMASSHHSGTTFVGFSPTPFGEDVRGTWKIIVPSKSTRALQNDGTLPKVALFAPFKREFDVDMTSSEALFETSSTWLAHGDSKPTLVYCVSQDHALAVVAHYHELGIPAASGSVGTGEFEGLRQRIARDELKIVTTIDALRSGFSFPFDCIIDAAPTRSKRVLCLRYGSGLIGGPMKYLDIAGNLHRHGLPLGTVSDFSAEGVFMHDVPWCTTCGAEVVGGACPACGGRTQAMPSSRFKSITRKKVELAPDPELRGLELFAYIGPPEKDPGNGEPGLFYRTPQNARTGGLIYPAQSSHHQNEVAQPKPRTDVQRPPHNNPRWRHAAPQKTNEDLVSVEQIPELFTPPPAYLKLASDGTAFWASYIPGGWAIKRCPPCPGGFAKSSISDICVVHSSEITSKIQELVNTYNERGNATLPELK